MTNLDLDIRVWVQRYIRGDVGLRDFQEWFVPATWDVHLNAPAAADVAYVVDAGLSLFDRGELSEQALKKWLRRVSVVKVETHLPVALAPGSRSRLTPLPAFG